MVWLTMSFIRTWRQSEQPLHYTHQLMGCFVGMFLRHIAPKECLIYWKLGESKLASHLLSGLYQANDHPDFNNNVKRLNYDKFTEHYAEYVGDCIEKGIEPCFDFSLANIKPLHARWTIESLAFAATQTQWMENALRGTGILPILDGSFIPDPLISAQYSPPEIVTAEEAAAPEPPSDNESGYESQEDGSAEDEPEQRSEASGDEMFEGEVDNTLVDRPVYTHTQLNDEDSDETCIVDPAPRRVNSKRNVVHEDDDDDVMNRKLPAPEEKEVMKRNLPAEHEDDTRNRKQGADIDNIHLEIAIAQSLRQVQPMYNPELVLQEVDNEGIDEELTRLSKELVQAQQWRVLYLDEDWQLAKRLLLLEQHRPVKIRKHPHIPSMIVSAKQLPNKIQKIPADGACLFNCLSFALFRDTNYSRMLREYICDFLSECWDEPLGRVKLFAAMRYQ